MNVFFPGIVASGITGHLNAYAPAGAYDALGSVVVGTGGVSSITFSNIPAGYRHLELRFNGYSTRTASNDIDDYNIRFNSDTGANYASHSFFGDGTGTPTYTATANASLINVPLCVGTLYSGSQAAGAGIITLLDYANTNKNKIMSVLGGSEINGFVNSLSPGRIGIASGMWSSFSIINSINLYCSNGNWGQYSSFALYGVK
jgi:hypothetical protein